MVCRRVEKTTNKLVVNCTQRKKNNKDFNGFSVFGRSFDFGVGVITKRRLSLLTIRANISSSNRTFPI